MLAHTLQMRKLRLREVEKLAQGPTVDRDKAIPGGQGLCLFYLTWHWCRSLLSE